jgi:hypothetical protein
MISEKILVIGSGSRVKDNFLPALFYLKKNYNLNIIGVYSKTYPNTKKVAEEWNLNALSYDTNLLSLDMSMVIISITTINVISTLLKLENYNKKLKVIIDTPAFIFFRNLPVLKKLSKKHDIFVASDFMYFPIFNLLREITNSKILGKLKKINLVNIGYYYHGTALLRSFLNFSPFLSIRKIGDAKNIFSALNTNKYIYKFKNSVSASISYPYNFEEGHIEVVFEEGTVTNKNAHSISNLDNNMYKIKNIMKDRVLLEHQVDIRNLKFISNSEYIPTLLTFLKYDKTNFNLHKTCGTIDFLRSILISNTKNKYDLFQGIYDAALSKKKISNLSYFVDPFSLFNKNFINIFWGKNKKY